MSLWNLTTFFAVPLALLAVAVVACAWLISRLGALAMAETEAKAGALKEGERPNTSSSTTTTTPLSVRSCSTGQVCTLATALAMLG